MTSQGRVLTIDTHQHLFPPAYRAMLDGAGAMTGGSPHTPEWSPSAAIEMMDRFGIGTGVLSNPVPSIGTAAESRYWARAVNEAGAQTVESAPQRFGYLATLTLPDVDGAIAEARYALDVLHADGVVLIANSQGMYLGDSRLEALMAELNERAAVVFVHPGNLPGPAVPSIPPFAADFLLDTTRAAINLTMSGTMDRYPDLKVILAHAGGFLPYIAYRIVPLIAGGKVDSTDEMRRVLRRFYFDLALSSSPTALPSLLELVDPTHITFGTDWPAAPTDVVGFFGDQFDSYPFTPDLRAAIARGNAERLFPRLAVS